MKSLSHFELYVLHTEQLHSPFSDLFLSGIVYVFSQKEAETLSSELQKRKIKASPYHAYMEPKDKSEVHHNWTTGKIKVKISFFIYLKAEKQK